MAKQRLAQGGIYREGANGDQCERMGLKVVSREQTRGGMDAVILDGHGPRAGGEGQ